MKKLFFVIALIIMILAIYNFHSKENVEIEERDDKDSYSAANKYLEDNQYTILSYEGNEKYTLTRQKLVEPIYGKQWMMQKERPDKYIGKTVYVERFIIKNHPLDNWYSHSKNKELAAKSLGKVYVAVFIADNIVVGGVSNPVTDVPVFGGYHSLDGKNFEDIHAIEYSQFRDDWFSRYKE